WILNLLPRSRRLRINASTPCPGARCRSRMRIKSRSVRARTPKPITRCRRKPGNTPTMARACRSWTKNCRSNP
ncbi:FIG00965772: hypothetical protein, partial [Pseudomonas sp. FEN]